jgi:hypothetical protein
VAGLGRELRDPALAELRVLGCEEDTHEFVPVERER